MTNDPAKTGEAARDPYLQTHSYGTLESITGRPNFNAEYKVNALWNLNMSPFKFYEDFGGEPSARPSGFSFSVAQIEQGQRHYESVWLIPGSEISIYVLT